MFRVLGIYNFGAGLELGILLYYLIKNGQRQIVGNSCSKVWAKYIKT
jgi:hypothetical protein